MSIDTKTYHASLHARRLLAGDVAKQLGIGVQTLHYYEREGLITPPDRTEAGYRLYTPASITRVAFIKKAQALGLPLQEIKEVVRLVERGTCPCGHVQKALAERLAEVDRRLKELRSFRRELAAVVERCGELGAQCTEGDICSIVEHAPNPQSAADVTARLSHRVRPRVKVEPALRSQTPTAGQRRRD